MTIFRGDKIILDDGDIDDDKNMIKKKKQRKKNSRVRRSWKKKKKHDDIKNEYLAEYQQGASRSMLFVNVRY